MIGSGLEETLDGLKAAVSADSWGAVGRRMARQLEAIYHHDLISLQAMASREGGPGTPQPLAAAPRLKGVDRAAGGGCEGVR